MEITIGLVPYGKSHNKTLWPSNYFKQVESGGPEMSNYFCLVKKVLHYKMGQS